MREPAEEGACGRKSEKCFDMTSRFFFIDIVQGIGKNTTTNNHLQVF